MHTPVPQSVALRVSLKVYLSSDHISDATGKTVAVTISKNGAAFGNPSAGATNATEIGNGWYYVDLSTTDTGTAGPLIVRGTSGSCDNAETDYLVVNAHNAGFDGVPSVTAGGTNGLLINGTNTGTVTLAALTITGATTHTGAVACNGGVTFTSSTGDGFVCSSTGSNGNGINASGNGTGGGLKATGGATGQGILVNGGGTSGEGIKVATTSGDGLSLVPTAGHAINATANGTTKHGINAVGGATTSHGIVATGGGVGHGILATSGSGATGDGIKAVAASTAGNGLELVHSGSGADLQATTTPLTLAKTTNITGFNDIAATAIVSGGAITTSGGAVSSVTLTATATNLMNLPSIPANWLTAAGIAAGALNGKGDWSTYAGGDTSGTTTLLNRIGGAITISAGAVTVGTNNDKTGYALTSGERTSIATALLTLDLSTVVGEAARSVLNAIRFLRNKWSVSGSTLTVTKEDDSTTAWTATVTSDSSANPITGSDPS